MYSSKTVHYRTRFISSGIWIVLQSFHCFVFLILNPSENREWHGHKHTHTQQNLTYFDGQIMKFASERTNGCMLVGTFKWFVSLITHYLLGTSYIVACDMLLHKLCTLLSEILYVVLSHVILNCWKFVVHSFVYSGVIWNGKPFGARANIIRSVYCGHFKLLQF